METNFSNIFKITNVTNLTKVIQEKSYRVLQVTSKQKTLKQHVYFLKVVDFCSTFDTQIDITLAIFQESCKTTLFRKPTEVSQNTPTFISIGPPITKSRPFKNMQNLCFFGGSFFKKILQTFGIFDELNFGQKFIIFEKVRCRGQLLLKLRAVEVATSFH